MLGHASVKQTVAYAITEQKTIGRRNVPAQQTT